MEQWRAVSGFPWYKVSDLGRVRGPRRYLKPTIEDGYERVRLYRDDGTKAMFRVHTLVLEAFVGPRPDDKVGRHKDGIRTNNRLSNLAWGTQAENEADKVTHGTSNRGEGGGKAKLTREIAHKIRSAYRPKSRGLGAASLAKQYGVAKSTVHSLLTGRTWRDAA